MWRRIALILVIAFVSNAAMTIHGQDRLPATLFSKCSAIRVEFVLGRLTILPLHRGQVRVAKSSELPEGPRESLMVNNDPQSSIVRYEWADEHRTATMEIVHYRQVHLQCESVDEGVSRIIEFQQPERGDIQFTVQEGDERREIKAHSFWHLMLVERKLCQQQLVPLFELLRPGWELTGMAERIEAGLFNTALTEPLVSRRYLAELVKQLDSPQFQSRRLADSQLRSFGPSILPFLDGLADHTLSGEQRARIGSIRQSIAGAATDSADRTATWLADDEQIWFALLKHADPHHRHLAAIRLADMRSDSLEFDPYGDESYREAQLAQLQSLIKRR